MTASCVTSCLGNPSITTSSSCIRTSDLDEILFRVWSIGVAHLTNRFFPDFLPEALTAPGFGHPRVDEVLLDGGELGREDVVQHRDDVVASHGGGPEYLSRIVSHGSASTLQADRAHPLPRRYSQSPAVGQRSTSGKTGVDRCPTCASSSTTTYQEGLKRNPRRALKAGRTNAPGESWQAAWHPIREVGSTALAAG